MFRKFDVLQPTIAEHIYNIVDYGAVGNGQVSNTKAFKEAILAANKTGGRVLDPDGIWLTGPIELLSGVELHLSDNAIILFDKNPEEYPLVGDDGICMKAGKNAEARKIVGPCENVHIHHCTVGNSHGGIVIGSEMGRGGVIEDIYMKRINMVNIKEEAIVLTMDYVLETLGARENIAQSGLDEDVPEFKNIFIEDGLCVGAEIGVRIKGMEWNGKHRPYMIFIL